MSTVHILQKLIGFPTLCLTPNEDLIDYVEDYLKGLEFRTYKLESEHSGRFSLLASIGPETDNGIIFSAHSDVVPVEGQPWTTDPFRMTEVDGKLVGRGTSDMKGFLACVLETAKYVSSMKEDLKNPLHIAISYDEEIGCVGVRSLLSYLKERNFKASGCIIGEPTEMKLVTGHKGKQAVKVICSGVSGHSSNPERGCNAILLACELVKEVEALQEDLKSDIKAHDISYEVPYTTAQIGLFNGGVALNIIPDKCEFQFEMRLLKSANADANIQRVRNKANELLRSERFKLGHVDIVKLNGYPGVSTPADAEFVSALASNFPPGNKAARINFGTEGGLFQEALNGIPTVCCGPGSIDRAHKADEWITEQELEDAVQFLKRTIDQLT